MTMMTTTTTIIIIIIIIIITILLITTQRLSCALENYGLKKIIQIKYLIFAANIRHLILRPIKSANARMLAQNRVEDNRRFNELVRISQHRGEATLEPKEY